ncbi:MAG: 4-hydroxy-tetrahydrodipicolinate reductase [Acidimicrobiales bacterium]|nr:4-hydroxy-tetrahydrodipicolinate reductase [Acidimicrobiales bacterium]
MIRVGVFGAGGRMGVTVCQAVTADPILQLVAAVDPSHDGLDARRVIGVDDVHFDVSGGPEAMVAAEVDVAIDFTALSAARENLEFCAANGIHAVVGTSGFTETEFAAIEAKFTQSNCLIAPNFAIGAVLMMRFAEMAAPFFETAEIIEFHHNNKVDAPSGTALGTAERMAAASSDWAADPTTAETLPGGRGAKGPGSIPIHSVRMVGMVAHQEVVLGTTGQSLVIRHDTTDRSSFMPGVILAVKGVSTLPGLTIGLDALLV